MLLIEAELSFRRTMLITVVTTNYSWTCSIQVLDTSTYPSVISAYVVGLYPSSAVFTSISELLALSDQGSPIPWKTTDVVNIKMTGTTKRKWRWSSKSLFASIAPNKAVKLDHSVFHTQDGAADLKFTNDMSLDGCSTEDSHRSGVAARMRRNGSKLLSVVGIQRGDE